RPATPPASLQGKAHAVLDGNGKPDVETSSAGYARRFAGPAGRYLLDTQSRSIAEVLRDLPPGRALDAGGGPGQLVPLLRSLGWHDCGFMPGVLLQLPAADRRYDLVISVRLVSHVQD